MGTIIVKALQPGDDTYSAAPTVNDTITVIKGDQVISFDSIPDQIFDANKITLVASSSMGQGISYSIIAGAAYASVSSNKITKKVQALLLSEPLKMGTVIIMLLFQ